MVWLDNSRFFAAVAVVVLHVAAGVILKADLGTSKWWVGNVVDSSVRWGVPVFVMISGALLLDVKRKYSLAVFYKKRFGKILVPLVFWSVFYLLWSCFKSVVKGGVVDVGSLFQSLINGAPYYHMWYLYMLVFLYAFVPFVGRIVAGSSESELRFLVIMMVFIGLIATLADSLTYAGKPIFILWFLKYLPYFLLGYLISIDCNSPPVGLLLFVFFGAVFSTACGFYFLASCCGVGVGLYFYDYMSVTVFLMSVSLMYLLKRWRSPMISSYFSKVASSLAFGVYLIHPVFLDASNFLIGSVVGYSAFLYIISVSFSVLFLSLLVAYLIKKIPYLRRVI